MTGITLVDHLAFPADLTVPVYISTYTSTVFGSRRAFAFIRPFRLAMGKKTTCVVMSAGASFIRENAGEKSPTIVLLCRIKISRGFVSSLFLWSHDFNKRYQLVIWCFFWI